MPSPIGPSGDPRHLGWEACHNVRDVGGYPTEGGGTTRWRALVRSDTLCRLTPEGTVALVTYGIRTVVDLRWPSLVAEQPYLLQSSDVTWLNISLTDESDPAGVAALSTTASLEDNYVTMLDRYQARFGAAISAIARARAGGVLVHCHAGKDRTGLVVALILAIVGVPATVIGADYALSDQYLRLHYEEDLRDPLLTSHERQLLQSRQHARPQTIRRVLTYLETHHGGVLAYCRAGGVGEKDVTALRARLVD